MFRVRVRMNRGLAAAAAATAVIAALSVARPGAQRPSEGPGLTAERDVAARVSEPRMVEAVRRLVGFGTRMYGTPSNHAAAAWLAAAYREAGLEVVVREDTPREWYLPVTWEVRVGPAGGSPAAVLNTVWPSAGAPAGKGEGALSIEAAPSAVCLVSKPPTPETTAGCVAVLFDGRTSASGWPAIGRLRGTWAIPVFGVSPQEVKPLRARVAAGETVRLSFTLDAQTGRNAAHTVVATLPGRDRSKYILFSAHGDADSGGPGANDNASGVAIILEIARTVSAAVKAGGLAQPACDLRFATWGGEIVSTREYASAMDTDASRLLAVFNFDQSGFGSSKEAIYVEPDDVPVNHALVTLVRGVLADHLGSPGFPERAASIKSQGGTDSYVFQNTRVPNATVYPAVTIYTSAWDRERSVPITEGFPPLNWYPGEQPGMVTVDGDAYYHSVGDTPANTTDKEPGNMGWCARVGLLSAWRLMRAR
jgi:hypothetical protein